MNYQGRLHHLQKDLMAEYYAQLTAASNGSGVPAAYLLIGGNPVELLRAFDILPVYPEVNALQLAVKKQSLGHIQAAEGMGYSTDNCAYVKADIGLYFAGRQTPFATIPEPSLLLCNYVGCNVYLHWFDHLAEYTKRPAFHLDIPFIRTASGTPTRADVDYVMVQLHKLIDVCEELTGKKLDYDRLRETVRLSSQTGDLWSKIKHLTKLRPAPYDAYFDSVTMMAPLYCLRGTPQGLQFFQTALEEYAAKAAGGEGPIEREEVRYVIEGPPPWPYLRAFRDMFTRWNATAVASTYSTVGGLWEFGFSHDPDRPLESIAEHLLQWNLTNRNFGQRYDQIAQYIDQWNADALIIHSVKSCRLFSAGQGDMRDYFTKLGVPTLLVESDLEDPRYFSEAQMRNRIDAFFESLAHRKATAATAAAAAGS
ncbi:MAG TPA: 2-hydroxyacyl-CoA dehydratase family protein [Candidatus Baltobacteraceae bacterium]|nr:2-hydroxyacyl-CoA dehydratase family protein [Candidatus Baltobacteraceae bacterium]